MRGIAAALLAAASNLMLAKFGSGRSLNPIGLYQPYRPAIQNPSIVL